MPLVFVHGVNVRKDDDYEKNVVSRSALFERLVLGPLAERDSRYQHVKVVNPYWGDLGVQSAWQEQSIPTVSVLESLGGSDGMTPADLEFMGTVHQLAPKDSSLERLGAEPGILKAAAARNPQRFLEAIVGRVGLSEISLKLRGSETPAQEGERQALLVEAARDVSRDPLTHAVDVLSFLAQPVFADADADLSYNSGVGLFNAHGAYFQRASFFEFLLTQIP